MNTRPSPLTIKTLFAFAAAAAALAPVSAQSPMRGSSQEEYQNFTREAMKSKKYDTSQGQDWDMRLTCASGTVLVRPQGSEDWSQVAEGEEMPLQSGDTVRTEKGGSAELYLDDQGAVHLNPATEVEVSSADQSDTTLQLRLGSLAAKIRHFLSDRFRLQVRTPSAVCAIRGTEFAVEYAPDSRETGVAVYDEGRVAVIPLDESGGLGQETLLEKNTEADYAPGREGLSARPIERFARHRARMKALRERLPQLKARWKRISPARRMELRENALKRRLIRKQIGEKVRDARKRKSGPARRGRRSAPGERP